MKICRHNLVKPVVMQSEPERILFMYDQLFREIILNSEEGNPEGTLSVLRDILFKQ